MKIVDAFIPVFEYMELLQKDLVEDSAKPVATVSDELKVLFSKMDALPHAKDKVELAFFAICAFIDEKLLESDWSEKEDWSKKTLQQSHFDTNIAGELFFSKLDALNENSDVEQQVREVYLYCLAQGFSGCYFNAGEQAFLQEIIQSNYVLLTQGSDESLFQSVHDVPTIRSQEDNINPQIKEHLSIWTPIVFVILCYFLFRNDLLDVVSRALSQM